MSDNADNKLNIDTSASDAEEKQAELQKRIIAKLTDGYGYELQDDTLSTWIIMIAVKNNTAKDAVKQELVEFIQENSEDFTNWLWSEVPKIWKPAVPKPAANKPKPAEAKVSKPQEKKKDNRGNPSNLIKKALDDTKKEANKESHKEPKNSSSYVKTNKDGRKVINLSKSEPHVEEEDRKEARSKKFGKPEPKIEEKPASSNVFDRLKQKGTNKGKEP